MNACAKRLIGRRDKSVSKEEWGIRPANDNIVDPLFRLEQQINTLHKKVADLMHVRNERPNDAEVSKQLDVEFVELQLLQSNYADALMTRYEARTDLPSRKDSDDFKEAMALVEAYEKAHSNNNQSS